MPTALKADGSDRLTKQMFGLRRKSGWNVNPQEQVTNLGKQFANFIVREFCYVPAHVRFVARVDDQLLGSYFWVD